MLFQNLNGYHFLFHFVSCQLNQLKKLGLFSEKNEYIGIEIL